MSRSAMTTWNQRVQKRLARAIGQAPLPLQAVEAAIETLARKMRIDPAILLGALAAKPIPTALWHEFVHGLVPPPPPREEDWRAMASAAEAVTSAFPDEKVTAWLVDPSQPADAHVLSSCLALYRSPEMLDVVATHSDPRMVEIGRSGLVPEAILGRAPAELRMHFRHLGRCWQVAPELRASVRFECAPPLELPGMQSTGRPGGFHLVVSRGQLVRLEPIMARRLAVRLHRSLRSDGFLLVGPADHGDRTFGDLEPHVLPGVLLYRKGDAPPAEQASGRSDFEALLAAVEAEPVAWEPRWQLACLLLREGYAESAMAHLRELVRWRPEYPGAWLTLATAYTLAGDIASARDAQGRAALAAAAVGAPELLM